MLVHGKHLGKKHFFVFFFLLLPLPLPICFIINIYPHLVKDDIEAYNTEQEVCVRACMRACGR